jgi:hypothetical protein
MTIQLKDGIYVAEQDVCGDKVKATGETFMQAINNCLHILYSPSYFFKPK